MSWRKTKKVGLNSRLGTSSNSYAGQPVYVTLQFSEILRPTEGSGGRLEHVPWVRLQPVEGRVDEGISIILAIAVIDMDGNLAELKDQKDGLPHRRRLIGESVEELRIRRTMRLEEVTGDETQVTVRENVPAGTIGPRADGGLRVVGSTEEQKGHLEITGNFLLPATTAADGEATAGAILSGDKPFIHNSGTNNFFAGVNAGNFSTTGEKNTAVGSHALTAHTKGSDNIAIGPGAGHWLTEGSNNIIIGSYNEAQGRARNEIENNVISIGTVFAAGEGGTSHTFISGIKGKQLPPEQGVPVLIGHNSQLGTIPSSRRVKEDVRDMADTTSNLLKLRPVQFTYKKDPTNTLQYRLIAEEVAEISPKLVVRSAAGEIETIRYHVLSSMLLNEIQKQHQALREKDVQIAGLASRLAALEYMVGADTESSTTSN